jgi:hypothetical protein
MTLGETRAALSEMNRIIGGRLRASCGKVGTGFLQKRCVHKDLQQAA